MDKIKALQQAQKNKLNSQIPQESQNSQSMLLAPPPGDKNQSNRQSDAQFDQADKEIIAMEMGHKQQLFREEQNNDGVSGQAFETIWEK